MFDTTVIGIFSVLLAYTSRFRFKNALEATILVLFFFIAFRYDWGSDYWAYLNKFQKYLGEYGMSDNPILSIIKSDELEKGWIILNILFAPIGFFALVIFLSIIELYLLYKFIKKHVHKRWYWYSIFLFIFTSSFMITGCSMMRQFLAMSLFLLGIDYIIDGKFFKYFVLVLLGATFHVSSLLLLPFYFIRYLKISFNIKMFFYFGLFFYLCVFFLDDIINLLIPYLLSFGSFEEYENYIGEKSTGMKSGLGVFISILLAIISLFYTRKMNRKESLIIYLSIFYIFLYPLYSMIPLIARYGFYFQYLTIAAYPIAFSQISNILIRYSVICLSIFQAIIGYVNFFDSPIWHDSIINYKTIFSAPFWM